MVEKIVGRIESHYQQPIRDVSFYTLQYPLPIQQFAADLLAKSSYRGILVWPEFNHEDSVYGTWITDLAYLQALQREGNEDKQALAQCRSKQQELTAQIGSLKEEAGKGREIASRLSNTQQEASKLKSQQEAAALDRDEAIKKRWV